MEKKSFNKPDASNSPSPKLKSDMIKLAGKELYRMTAQPGWKWTVDLGPIVGTDTCQMDHLLYVISGRMMIKLDSGTELELGPGDIVHIPPGHDGWGLGDEPTVWIEIPH